MLCQQPQTYCIYLLLLFFFLMILGFELTWAMPPALFALTFTFMMGSHALCTGWPQTAILLHTPHTQLVLPCLICWVRWGLTNLLPRLTLNHDPPNHYFPSNWGGRHAHTTMPCLYVVSWPNWMLDLYLLGLSNYTLWGLQQMKSHNQWTVHFLEHVLVIKQCNTIPERLY
jgi:hypothetical protein